MKATRIMAIVSLSLTGIIWLCNFAWLTEVESYPEIGYAMGGWLFFLGGLWIAQNIVMIVYTSRKNV